MTIRHRDFSVPEDQLSLCTVTRGIMGISVFAAKLINIGRERCVDTYLKYFKGPLPNRLNTFTPLSARVVSGLLRKMAG